MTRLLARAAAVALGLAAVLAASELGYRVARRFVCTGRGFVGYVPDARFGWTHEAGGGGLAYGCVGRAFEFRIPVRINSHGLRDREHAYAKPTGTRRVLVLGDSIAEAYQVEHEEAFPELLESELSAPGAPVEVINAGVAAFATDNQVLFYEAEGVRYAPDVVVSLLNLQNDVGDNSPDVFARHTVAVMGLPKAHARLDASGAVELDTTPFAAFERQYQERRSRWGLWLEHELYAVRALRRIASAYDVKAPANEAPDATSPAAPAPAAAPPGCSAYMETFVEPPDETWSQAWALTSAFYARLQRSVAASGAKLLVVLVPAKEAVVPWAGSAVAACIAPVPPARIDLDAPGRRARAMLEALGIPYVDTTGAFQACEAATGNAGPRCYFRLDPHPDADGHRLIADALAQPVARLLEARPPSRAGETL